MKDALTALIEASIKLLGRRSDEGADEYLQLIEPDDVAMAAIIRHSFLRPDDVPNIHAVVDALMVDPDLECLRPSDDGLDPFVMYTGGGTRISPLALVLGLLGGALQHRLLLGLPNDEATFVALVAGAFEELRRTCRGEPTRVLEVTGFSGVSLPEAVVISTPWGDVRSIRTEPPHRSHQMMMPQTACTIVHPALVIFSISREAQPEMPELDPEAVLRDEQRRNLFPLVCALASTDSPVGAIPTWTTTVVPFQGHAWSSSRLPMPTRAEVDLGPLKDDVEEWARIVAREHVPSIDVAARRLVSATSHRTDQTDSLIDAVMVWEALVGTTTETTFRVTASLAKLLEDGPDARQALRKELASTYDTRSRVVHGNAVDPTKIDESAALAVDVATRALRASYQRGKRWLELTSKDRSDDLLLG